MSLRAGLKRSDRGLGLAWEKALDYIFWSGGGCVQVPYYTTFIILLQLPEKKTDWKKTTKASRGGLDEPKKKPLATPEHPNQRSTYTHIHPVRAPGGRPDFGKLVLPATDAPRPTTSHAVLTLRYLIYHFKIINHTHRKATYFWTAFRKKNYYRNKKSVVAASRTPRTLEPTIPTSAPPANPPHPPYHLTLFFYLFFCHVRDISRNPPQKPHTHTYYMFLSI